MTHGIELSLSLIDLQWAAGRGVLDVAEEESCV
jgi:hypothetical protein